MTGAARRDIAVVGISCRVPGARDYRQYWQNLAAGVESVTFLSDDELRSRGVDERRLTNPNWVKAAQAIDEMEDFDARFFGYTAREAEILDPQIRLFLESCYAALEDGSCDVERYDGVVGVFGGMGETAYRAQHVERNAAAMAAMGHMAVEVSNSVDYLATTVSHRLNLRGPSVNVQTACSTSLVAFHLAARSLREGECDLALAGGVGLQLPYRTGYWWTEGGITSRDGHCRAFDAAATGTVFGTGVGVVALKRLADAEADGDHIYAVVRGSAVNNDGAARAGFAAPGVDGQASLVSRALAEAEVTPESISYVEAHGTGTLVGDPIEWAALTRAFRDGGDRSRQRCRIGTVKPNVGHLSAASGVVGLIKVCLAFAAEQIPPSVNFTEPNPRIDFDDSPFVVDTSLCPWPRGEAPRRAAVSSFGVGGTNAHVILEEPPRPPARRPSGNRRHQVVPVSAKTETALAAATRQLAERLEQAPDLDLRQLAYTLQTGRGQFAYRRAVVAGTPAQASAALTAGPAGKPTRSRPRSVAFLFPGQGTQYPGMGHGLYETEPVFREAVDECAELLSPVLGLELRSLLFPPSDPEEAAQRLRETWLTQPAVFTIEYAVAATCISWGIKPAAMMGHSIGEWVAAQLAGVFTLGDALTLVANRGRLMQSMPPGAMLAIPIGESQVRDLLDDELEIAAVNGPAYTVVSGPVEQVDLLQSRLQRLALQPTRLHTSHAFHSRAMEPLLGEFRQAVAAVPRSAPQIPIVSNVTGGWLSGEQAVDPEYWSSQLRASVRFADGIGTLLEDPDRLLLETGPGDVLTALAKQSLGDADAPTIVTMRGPHRRADDAAVLADAVARLWTAGVTPDWDRYWGRERPARTPLPVYPFERRRHWLEPDPRPAEPVGAGDERPDALPLEQAVFATRWVERSLDPVSAPEVAPHWLLLSSGNPVFEVLRDRLAGVGARVSFAVAGERFTQVADDRFTVRPGQQADLAELLAAVSAAGVPTRIVHGFALTDAVADPIAPQVVTAETDQGFFSLLQLAQELPKVRGDREVALFAVSTNVNDVIGTETLEPAKSMLLGPTLLVGRELSGVTCRSIDFVLPAQVPAQTMAGQLFTELVAPATETRVAWRGRKRWVWDYESVTLDEPVKTPTTLREQGVYLIPGGLGGIGLTLAVELARIVRARLVLVGRNTPPERSRWPELLADPATPPDLRDRIHRLREVEAAGGELLIRACDITDESQIAAVVAEAESRFGAVHGVFHSAGVAGGGMLEVKTRQEAERVLAPKVAGTLALHRVLGGRVDFMVLFSSITAVVGDFGLVDYCAANNFQDAFALRAAARGEPVYSIGWALWRDSGMGAGVSETVPMLLRELLGGARSEPVAHPLLDRRIYDDSGDIIFASLLHPGSHWILTDHRIGEVQVMPGTALIEMIRAAFDAAVGGPVELRELVFIGPIAITEPTELRVILRPDGDEFYVAVVAGAVAHGLQGGTTQVKARLARGEGGPAPVHDLAAITGRCDRWTADFRHRPEGLVSYGEHWHNVGLVHIGEQEEIGRLELDPRFHSECADYVLHPGLFDDAVSNAQYLELGDGAANYLPLSYGRIVVHGSLPPAFSVHIRHLNPGDKEQIVSDIVLIDDDGRELVRVERYAGRRVEPAAIESGLAGADGAGSMPAGSVRARGDGASWTITDEFAMEALRRILQHLPKPHVIVCPEGLDRNLQRIEGMTSDLLARELAETQLSIQPAGERITDTPYVAPEGELQELLATLLQSALGIKQVGAEDDFFELGGNSLVAVQLGFRLREHFDMEIPIAALLEKPTVRGLAELLDQMLREKVAAMSDEEAAELLARST